MTDTVYHRVLKAVPVPQINQMTRCHLPAGFTIKMPPTLPPVQSRIPVYTRSLHILLYFNLLDNLKGKFNQCMCGQ